MRHFILGTDWWTDCDDAVALRILARAHQAGEICLDAIAINAAMEYSVPSLEGFLNTEGVKNIQLGLDAEARIKREETVDITAAIGAARNNPAAPTGIIC